MSKIFDLLSVLSVVGIGPRFIEPYRLRITHRTWNLEKKEAGLEGIKIAQLSDLHLGPHVPSHFLDTIVRKTMSLKPDLILFTGDFLCFSSLEDPHRLQTFLKRLQAPMGCFATLGNHDYNSYVYKTETGDYQVGQKKSPFSIMKSAFKMLSSPPLSQKAPEMPAVEMHRSLCELIVKDSPFTLLENTTVTLDGRLNLTGLGEFSLGRCRPETAFKGYERSLPGIVLTHNPDSFPSLLEFPGQWILAGHTHGEQIHFPYPKFLRNVSKKMTRLNHPQYSRGYRFEKGKHLYTNRGLGSSYPFRIFSRPEILLITGRRDD